MLCLIDDIFDIFKVELGKFEMNWVICLLMDIVNDVICVMVVKVEEKEIIFFCCWDGVLVELMFCDENCLC